MKKYLHEKYILPYVEKFIVYRPGRYIFTEHLWLNFIHFYEIETTIDKANFVKNLLYVLRAARGKACEIPETAFISSPDTARGVSPERFMKDNGFSPRALMDFDWVKPKSSKYLEPGVDYMLNYLENPAFKIARSGSKTKSLYFLRELELKNFYTEEGLTEALNMYKKHNPDLESFGHNNNIMLMITGIFDTVMTLKKNQERILDLLKDKKE